MKDYFKIVGVRLKIYSNNYDDAYIISFYIEDYDTWLMKDVFTKRYEIKFIECLLLKMLSESWELIFCTNPFTTNRFAQKAKLLWFILEVKSPIILVIDLSFAFLLSKTES